MRTFSVKYDHAAGLLKQAGWNAEQTRKVLIELVAPAAGGNLGFLIWPVIGEWAGFDEDDICERIERRQAARERNPKGFRLSDWWCARILKALKMDDFLLRLA